MLPDLSSARFLSFCKHPSSKWSQHNLILFVKIKLSSPFFYILHFRLHSAQRAPDRYGQLRTVEARKENLDRLQKSKTKWTGPKTQKGKSWAFAEAASTVLLNFLPRLMIVNIIFQRLEKNSFFFPLTNQFITQDALDVSDPFYLLFFIFEKRRT